MYYFNANYDIIDDFTAIYNDLEMLNVYNKWRHYVQ